MSLPRSSSDPSKKLVDETALIAECKQKKERVQKCTTLTEAQKSIVCSGLDEMIVNTENAKVPSLDCLATFELLANATINQNAALVSAEDKLRSFQQQHHLERLSNEDLILFCSDAERFNRYYLLGAELNTANRMATLINHEFKESINKAAVALRLVYTLRDRLLNLERDINTLKKEKIHTDFTFDFCIAIFSIQTKLERITYFTSDGETPSDLYLKVCNAATASWKAFTKAQPETAQLIACYQSICNIQANLTKYAAIKRGETEKPEDAPATSLDSPTTSAPKSAMFKIAGASPTSSPRMSPKRMGKSQLPQ